VSNREVTANAVKQTGSDRQAPEIAPIFLAQFDFEVNEAPQASLTMFRV
jgi:hypothetical protein